MVAKRDRTSPSRRNRDGDQRRIELARIIENLSSRRSRTHEAARPNESGTWKG